MGGFARHSRVPGEDSSTAHPSTVSAAEQVHGPPLPWVPALTLADADPSLPRELISPVKEVQEWGAGGCHLLVSLFRFY